MTGLSSLEFLNLASNRLTAFPEEFQAPKLRKLWMWKNQLNRLPKCIAALESLESLAVDDNVIAELPEEIGNLRRLRNLGCRGNRLKTLPSSFASLHSLEYLSLSGNPIEQLPEGIGEFVRRRARGR